MVSAMLLTSSNMVFADMILPYVGADLGVDKGTWRLKDLVGNRINMNGKGVFGDLFVGIAWTSLNRLYLGLEAFGNQSSTRSPTRQLTTSPGQTGAVLRM